MPYKKSYKRAPRRRPYRRNKFVPRGLAVKRANQVSTKTFYFKGVGKIAASNPGGLVLEDFRTVAFNSVAPTIVPNVPGDFSEISRGYQQYKVLAIRLTLFAANVGVESAATGTLRRGITCIFKDQEVLPTTTVFTNMSDVINQGSAKVIPSRIDKWTTTIYRAKGHPEWGNCDKDTPQINRLADSWQGGINVLGNGVTPGLVWFYTTNYKVVFRGRNYA